MLKTLLAIPMLLVISSFSAAGETPGGYAYVVVGPVVVPQSAYTRWNGDFISVTGGGETRVIGRFALGGEMGVLKPVTNQYAVATGVASVSPAFHFVSKHSGSKVDPFVNGGFSLLFGRGSGIGMHYGGGVNYWVRRRVGLRFEFRHYLWSPESGELVHLVGFRFGIVLHTG